MKKLTIIIMVIVMVMIYHNHCISSQATTFKEGRAFVAGQDKYQNTYYVCYEGNCIQYDLDAFVEEIVDEHYCKRAVVERPTHHPTGVYKVVVDGYTIGYVKTVQLP